MGASLSYDVGITVLLAPTAYTSVLVQLTLQKQLGRVDNVPPRGHGHAMCRFQALVHHRQLLVGTPAMSSFSAEQLATFIVAVNHEIPLWLFHSLRRVDLLSFMCTRLTPYKREREAKVISLWFYFC